LWLKWLIEVIMRKCTFPNLVNPLCLASEAFLSTMLLSALKANVLCVDDICSRNSPVSKPVLNFFWKKFQQETPYHFVKYNDEIIWYSPTPLVNTGFRAWTFHDLPKEYNSYASTSYRKAHALLTLLCLFTYIGV
jgi:hypothetical protein